MSCMVYPEGRGKTVKDRLPVPEGCRSPIRVVYYRFYHTYFYLAVETDKKDLLQQAFLDGGFRLPCGFSGCFRSAFPWQARKRLRGQRGQRQPCIVFGQGIGYEKTGESGRCRLNCHGFLLSDKGLPPVRLAFRPRGRRFPGPLFEPFLAALATPVQFAFAFDLFVLGHHSLLRLGDSGKRKAGSGSRLHAYTPISAPAWVTFAWPRSGGSRDPF